MPVGQFDFMAHISPVNVIIATTIFNFAFDAKVQLTFKKKTELI